MCRILIIFALTLTAAAQGWIGHTELTTSAPSGGCQPGQVSVDTVGQALYVCPAGGTWGSPLLSNGGGGVPSGIVAMITSGSCATGWTEVSALNGKMLKGTLAANGDVGTTGGNATITPTGTVSQPTFTGDAFTSVISHTHTVNITDPGHTHTINATTYVEQAQGGTTAATTGTHVMTSTATGGSVRSVESTVSKAPTEASATTGITATTSAPAGSVSSITPTGTVSQPTFTGNAIDPSPSFTKVIFCSKN